MNSDYRKMRVILLFDLPVVESEERSAHQKFVRNLKKIGFYMLQFSVYVKTLANQSEYLRLEKKVTAILPKKGHIIILRMTEKQFSDMIYLSGEKNRYDMIVSSKNVVIIGDEKND